MPDDQGQRQARFLTAGKIDDRLGHAVAAKIETAQKIANFLFAGAGVGALNQRGRAGLHVNHIDLVLGKIANAQMLGCDHLAIKYGQLFGQGLQ